MMSTNSKRKIIIAGPGASGKDYFARFLEQNNLKKAVDYTTRPKRCETESEYNFVSEIPIEDCYHIFKVNGRDWKYGYSKKEILESDFIIVPPSVIFSAVHFLQENQYEYVIVYFDISEEFRKKRLLGRNDSDIDRRLKTDREDFESFSALYNPDIVVKCPVFKPHEVYNKLVKLL